MLARMGFELGLQDLFERVSLPQVLIIFYHTFPLSNMWKSGIIRLRMNMRVWLIFHTALTAFLFQPTLAGGIYEKAGMIQVKPIVSVSDAKTLSDIFQSGFSHSSSTVKMFVREMAQEYGVDPDIADFIVKNESNYGWKEGFFNPAIKGSPYICDAKKSKNYGKISHDRGILQISSCWYPNISDDEANDPIKALELMLPIMKKDPNQWAVYKFCQKWWKEDCPF